MSESMTNQEEIIAEKNEAIDRMAHNAMRDAATIVRLLALLKQYDKDKKVCMFCNTRYHTDDCELMKVLEK